MCGTMARALVFEYEVQSDDLDTDGISIAADALSLNDATIQDRGGNPADLDLSEHVISNEINDGNHKVDGSIDHPPTVEWTGFDSSPASGDTYGVGEPIAIVVQFNEPVEVSGTPQLELTIGIAVRSMQLEDVWDDDRGLVFRYQVQAEDRDDNGIQRRGGCAQARRRHHSGPRRQRRRVGSGRARHQQRRRPQSRRQHRPPTGCAIEACFVSKSLVNGDTHGIRRTESRSTLGSTSRLTVTGTPELDAEYRQPPRGWWTLVTRMLRRHRMDSSEVPYYQVQAA